jgi:hypothetical protein
MDARPAGLDVRSGPSVSNQADRRAAMNRSICLWGLLLGGILGVVAALAHDDASLYGTNRVEFLPVHIDGLEGCALVYQAMQADPVHPERKPVSVSGQIGVFRTRGGSLLALKIGLKDVAPHAARAHPNFAYLQSASWSTAKRLNVASDLGEGFAVFGISLSDPVAVKLVDEMLDWAKVTVGFDRVEGGADVLVPLDLTVSSAEAALAGSFRRKHSPEAITRFRECLASFRSNEQRLPDHPRPDLARQRGTAAFGPSASANLSRLTP